MANEATDSMEIVNKNTQNLYLDLPVAPTGALVPKTRRTGGGGGGPVGPLRIGTDPDDDDGENCDFGGKKRKTSTGFVEKKRVRSNAQEHIDFLLEILHVGASRVAFTADGFYDQIEKSGIPQGMIYQMLERIVKQLEKKEHLQDADFLKLRTKQTHYEANGGALFFDDVPKVPRNAFMTYYMEQAFNNESTEFLDEMIEDFECLISACKWQKKHAVENRGNLETLKRFLAFHQALQLGYALRENVPELVVVPRY